MPSHRMRIVENSLHSPGANGFIVANHTVVVKTHARRKTAAPTEGVESDNFDLPIGRRLASIVGREGRAL
jgi:hypothetical protein